MSETLGNDARAWALGPAHRWDPVELAKAELGVKVCASWMCENDLPRRWRRERIAFIADRAAQLRDEPVQLTLSGGIWHHRQRRFVLVA